jgi:uncharacterized phage-like protein YoqJ
MMILAGTGHRPGKLGGYHANVAKALEDFCVAQLHELKPDLVISGMALGFDQALARAAVRLEIPFHAYVPSEEQDSVWPYDARKKYRDLLSYAAYKHVVFPTYLPQAPKIRNERMVDACTDVIALWNGTPGGTQHCVRYAERKNKPIHHRWQHWIEGEPIL